MHVRMGGGSSELQVFSGGKSKQRERERDLHNNTEQCIPLQQYNSTQPSHTFTSQHTPIHIQLRSHKHGYTQPQSNASKQPGETEKLCPNTLARHVSPSKI